MKEIIIKKDGRVVVKLPFDRHIVDDYNELMEQAKDEKVTISIVGSDRDLSPGSVVFIVATTGVNFKPDKFTNEPVLWLKARVVEANDVHYPAGMEVWMKFSKVVLHGLGCDTVDGTRVRMVGRKIIVTGIGVPKSKPGEGVNFVFDFNAVSMVT